MGATGGSHSTRVFITLEIFQLETFTISVVIDAFNLCEQKK